MDPRLFDAAVASASAVLDEARDHIYEAALFHRYTAAIITGMGVTVRALMPARRTGAPLGRNGPRAAG